MTLRVIGAGLGRTGTLSLKAALERLLGGPCYHMSEVMAHPEHVPLWHRAARGEPVDFDALLAGYVAAVDWPASAFWPELAERFPDALVVLSVRDADAWWRSASATIFPTLETRPGPWREMVEAMFAARFTLDIQDREACIAAYEASNARVRAGVPASRLLEWRASEGYLPLCRALGVPVPDEAFPHVNTTEQFLARSRGHA